MSLKYEIKYSQSNTVEGRAYLDSYFLDDSVEKIAEGKLFGLKSDGTSKAPLKRGKTVLTMVEADNTLGIPAVGVVWRTSARAVDTTQKEMALVEDANYYPFGSRESSPLEPINEIAVTVIDSERKFHFNTVKKQISGTVEIVAGSLDTIVGTDTAFLSEVRIGDYVNVDGEKREILTKPSDTSATVTVDFSEAKVAGTAIYTDSDVFRKVYTGANGAYTKITPAIGEDKQVVGIVANGNDIRVEIKDFELVTVA